MAETVELPREADDDMRAAGALAIRDSLRQLAREGRIADADLVVAGDVYKAMADDFLARSAREQREAEKTPVERAQDLELEQLLAAGLTLDPPAMREGEMVLQVTGPAGAFGYIPASERRSASAWWCLAEPRWAGGGVASLITAATRTPEPPAAAEGSG